jgi:hypothetical protein
VGHGIEAELQAATPDKILESPAELKALNLIG